MKNPCYNGLHDKPHPWGKCLECEKARYERMAQKRYSRWPAPDWIPCSVLVPIMQRWLDAEDRLNEKASGTYGEEHMRYPVRATLAARSGVSERQIYRYLAGEGTYIRFDIADKLMCAMDLNYLWTMEPLAEYYFAGLSCDVEGSLAA